MRALRNIHSALIPGGVIVDTQPVSPSPPVVAASKQLGRLDMREWANTIRAVDQRLTEVIAAGLFAIESEEQFVVRDTFKDGSEGLTTAAEWCGTLVPAALRRRLDAARAVVTVEQDVRLRLLRSTNLSEQTTTS